MSRKKKRKRKLPGHYCWSCDRRRPNEKFSGSGHARHICRECARLGSEELAYRQALRNLDRCMTWEGIIPRKRRKAFEQFLEHEDPRIRALAHEMLEEDLFARRMPAEELDAKMAEADERWANWEPSGEAESDRETALDEIPF